ncbi:MAG: hypothetical protein ACQEVA_01205 [Myxococcota bacterium]
MPQDVTATPTAPVTLDVHEQLADAYTESIDTRHNAVSWPACVGLLLVIGASILTGGCASPGAMESGRVAPAGHGQIVLGITVRREALAFVDVDDPVRQEVERLRINPWSGLDVDLFAVGRFGLGSDFEGEIGFSGLLAATLILLGHCHNPGLIVGLKHNVVSESSFATALGLRWTGEVFVAGYTHISRVAWTQDLQLRATTSWDWADHRTTYLSPNVSYRWIHYASRHMTDRTNEWATLNGQGYLLGLNLGHLEQVVGTNNDIGIEVGADVAPMQDDLESTTIIPRFGVGTVSRADDE